MSLRKLKFWQTPNFNFTLLGVSLLILLAVLLRRFYQRRSIADLGSSERKAVRAAVLAAIANLLVFVVGAVVIVSIGSRLSGEIPFSLQGLAGSADRCNPGGTVSVVPGGGRLAR